MLITIDIRKGIGSLEAAQSLFAEPVRDIRMLKRHLAVQFGDLGNQTLAQRPGLTRCHCKENNNDPALV